MIATFLSRPATPEPELPKPGSEGGFMLLEVIVSALLVALIAVGTYSGLVSADRAGTGERASAQATVIAQQDEERLRGLSVSPARATRQRVTYTVRRKRHVRRRSLGSVEVLVLQRNPVTTSCETVTGYSKASPTRATSSRSPPRRSSSPPPKNAYVRNLNRAGRQLHPDDLLGQLALHRQPLPGQRVEPVAVPEHRHVDGQGQKQQKRTGLRRRNVEVSTPRPPPRSPQNRPPPSRAV